MNAKRVIPTLTVAAACTVGAVPLASAQAAEIQQASSGNWSGYVVGSSAQNRTFKTVTGSWVQPTAKCSVDGGSTYAAFWVGLGGADNKEALEQDGTEVNCGANGEASYYAWYELVPKAPVKVDLAVHPGDHMTATTTVNGTAVTETIVNHTTGDSFTKTLHMSDPDVSSAEWIAEAPSTCSGSLSNCSALSLSDFGSVHFTNASATDSAGHTGGISDSSWTAAALTLTPEASASGAGSAPVGYGGGGYGGGGYGYGGGAVSTESSSGGASPSSLTGSGSAFSVSYRKETSTSSTSSYGSGSGAGSYGSGGGDGSTGDGYGGGSDGYGYGYGSSGDGYGYGYGYGSDGYGYGYGAEGGYGSGGYSNYGDSSSTGTGNGGYVIISAY